MKKEEVRRDKAGQRNSEQKVPPPPPHQSSNARRARHFLFCSGYYSLFRVYGVWERLEAMSLEEESSAFCSLELCVYILSDINDSQNVKHVRRLSVQYANVQ